MATRCAPAGKAAWKLRYRDGSCVSPIAPRRGTTKWIRKSPSACPPQMSTKRLFVSVELPHAITQLLGELDPHLRGVRWLAPEQMHLTLSFLGDVSAETEEKLRANLCAISW